MTQDDSGTTSTDEARAHGASASCAGAGSRTSACWRRWPEVPRELFLPEEQRRRAYRDGALRIGEGQTISQPWIVACMAQLLELDGRRAVLEVGTGSGYAAAVLSRLCAEVVTIERFESLAAEARAALAELGYDNVEVRVGDGARGAPDRAPFGGISVTATASGEPPARAVRPARARAPRWSARSRAGGREHLMRFRDGEAEAVAVGALRAAGQRGARE